VTNHIHDGVDILMHCTGREAQGLEARAAENLIATSVVTSLFELLVVGPIHLDDEPSA